DADEQLPRSFELERPPLLWNVFPLHPYEPGNQMTNRPHRVDEFRETEDLLTELLAQLKPRCIVAIGNDAFRVLRRLGHPAILVRHPSYGGQVAFIEGIAALRRGIR